MHFEETIRLNIARLADLKKTTADLQRELSHTTVSLERELAESARDQGAAPERVQETCHCPLHDTGHVNDAAPAPAPYAAQVFTPDYDNPDSGGPAFDGAGPDGLPFGGPGPEGPDFDSAGSGDLPHPPEGRTAELVNHGRRSVYHRGLSSRGRKIAAVAAALALLVTILVTVLSRSEASWPPSVATVRSEISKACQNPDVKSEPGQVNFACGKTTRQILWVFALMTSGNDPDFTDAKTGRRGLEPITPAQGGKVALSLNLHHPYNPADPVDSLEVAARAINNIIGGATLTDANGHPAVQAGLESHPANCMKYTGSAAVISREGFPNRCARPITGQAGQAALVADVYQEWVVGATAKTAHAAAVLFANADNPGDPRVRAILKNLPKSRLSP